jgi:hypothetical protein
MRTKSTAMLAVMIFTLLAVSPVAFADTYSPWSDSYSGVQFQYVKQFAGNDWDGLRWHNGNGRKAEVSYTMQMSNGSKTNNLIYLEKGETSSISAIAAGQRVISIGVKLL